MKQKFKRLQRLDIMYIVLSFQILQYFVYRYIWYTDYAYVNFCDFRLRWYEEAYFLLRIDPVDAINGVNGIVTPDIMAEGGNLPWVYIYNLFLCLPWLQQDTALLVYRIFQNIAVWGLNYLQLRELINTYNVNRLESLFMLVQMLCGMPMIFCLQTGNTGFMIPQLILYQLLTFNKSEKHEWLQIALICMALNKPQIAALYCLIVFIYRPLKTIICGQVSIGIPWIVASVMLKKDPIQLALNFWNQTGKTYNSGVVTGWLNPWIAEGYMSRQTGQLITMGITIAIVSVVSLYNKYLSSNSKITETEAIFKQAALAQILTIGWMYVNKMDYYIVFIAVILLVAIDRVKNEHKISSVDILSASAINIICIQRADAVRMSTGNLGIRVYQNLLIMILWVIWLWQLNIQSKHTEQIKTILRFLIGLAAAVQVIQVCILGITII